MKKILFLFLILFFCISISEGFVAGISPPQRNIELPRGGYRNVSFGISTNSEETIIMDCEPQSEYLSCPKIIEVVRGEITYFNITANVPEEYEFETMQGSFVICKNIGMIRYCLEGKVNAMITEPEEVEPLKPQNFFNINILILLSTFAILSFLLLFKNKLKKYFKQ